MSTPAFAAGRESEVDGQASAVCTALRPGAGKIIQPGGGKRPLSACVQAQAGRVVAERALAQTGLAIGLASTVLQSQIAILTAILNQSTSCTALTGGGSVQSNAAATAVTVYYGANCSQPYIAANTTTTTGTTADANLFIIAETASYYGLSGNTI